VGYMQDLPHHAQRQAGVHDHAVMTTPWLCTAHTDKLHRDSLAEGSSATNAHACHALGQCYSVVSETEIIFTPTLIHTEPRVPTNAAAEQIQHHRLLVEHLHSSSSNSGAAAAAAVQYAPCT
jgi:hypothetical protein